MKGIVFTEFLDMVEKEFGYEVVDKIIEASTLDSGGVYTAVGTYHHSEVVQLLTNLSLETETAADILLKKFGAYLFDTFLSQYPQFFEAHERAFDFLESIDSHIHVEVKKLYPAATLPRFDTSVNEEGQMVMIYQSERKMGSLALGLIEKSMSHYNEASKIEVNHLNEDATEVQFVITLE